MSNKNPGDDIGSANVSLRHYFYSRFFGKRSPPSTLTSKRTFSSRKSRLSSLKTFAHTPLTLPTFLRFLHLVMSPILIRDTYHLSKAPRHSTFGAILLIFSVDLEHIWSTHNSRRGGMDRQSAPDCSGPGRISIRWKDWNGGTSWEKSVTLDFWAATPKTLSRCTFCLGSEPSPEDHKLDR